MITSDDYNWAVEYKKYNEEYINFLTANFNNFTEKENEENVQFISDLKVINQELHKIIVVYEKQNEASPNNLYTVMYGDTLLSISNKFYKDFSRWEDIFAANKLNDIMLETGQILIIPSSKAELL